MGERERLTVLALLAAFALHTMSNSLQGQSGDGTYGGLFFTPNLQGDTEVIAGLVEKRQTLLQEISNLQATVNELQRASLTTASAAALPAVPEVPPPAVPPPSGLGLVSEAPSAPAAAFLPVDVSPPSPPPPLPPPAAVPAAAASAAQLISRGDSWVFAGEPMPPNLADFPCALREFKKAQVTTSCELACRGDDSCARAKEVCSGYVECSHIVVNIARGEPLGGATVVLKKDSTKAIDNSRQLLHAAKWWGSNAMTTQTRPRIYIVASYGGCGSKMMAGWLSQLPGHVKQWVYHLHDRHPPDALRHMPKPPAPSMKSDFRTGRFPGGSKFKSDTPLVSDSDLDAYRVVYLYKDPVEAMVSRFGHGHCTHIQGDCGPSDAQFPKLDKYADMGQDRMRLNDHFNAFMRPSTLRNYPVVAINYHKLWDNLPAVMEAFGLPQEFVQKFPPRTETVRNDLTGKAEGNAAHTEKTRNGLKRMYSTILDDIRNNPAVRVV